MGATGGLDDRRLRIVIVGLNYAPEATGIAPYTTGLARDLAARGHDVVAVTGHPHYPEWRLHAGYDRPRPPEFDHGVVLLRVPHPVPRNPNGLSRVWMEAVFAVRSAPHLLRRRPDVVIVVSPALLALVPALLLRPFARYRLGAVIQDLYGAAMAETGLAGGLAARLTARLEIALLRRAQGIAVIHEVFRRSLRACGIPDERIAVIRNWSHITMPLGEDRAEVRRSLGWRDDEFVAVHAGNMGAKQGLEGLIDAARLALRRNRRIRIVLLGDGSRKAALRAYAGDRPPVTFLDPLPEGRFESALAAADCLLLHEKPGVLEMSVPSKLTTYFMAGRPVVAATDSRSGAAAMMFAAGAGITVPAGEGEAIVSAIERLAADPGVAEKYGMSGREYADRELASAASLSRYEAWVRQLAGRT